MLNREFQFSEQAAFYGGSSIVTVSIFGLMLALTASAQVAFTYAIIAFGLAMIGRKNAIRGLRAASGKCPECGYDLRGLPDERAVCPECGRKEQDS